MKDLGKWAPAAGLGLELVALEVLFLYAGRYLDIKYVWPGYGMTFGGLIGLIIWLVHVVSFTKRLEK